MSYPWDPAPCCPCSVTLFTCMFCEFYLDPYEGTVNSSLASSLSKVYSSSSIPVNLWSQMLICRRCQRIKCHFRKKGIIFMPYFGKIECEKLTKSTSQNVDISKISNVPSRRLISYRRSWLCLYICAVPPNLPSSYQALQQVLCMPIHTGEPRKSSGLRCGHPFSRTVC